MSAKTPTVLWCVIHWHHLILGKNGNEQTAHSGAAMERHGGLKNQVQRFANPAAANSMAIASSGV
ncbi:hypothetical protein, partial [Burkholderia ubonensis]|uniref:hypothetical protein n=1 Tax=Burkholderia ubonensis TaxID=101571 RepID=UPI001E5DEA50